MNYHSENLVRTVVLAAIRQGKMSLGNDYREIEKAALRNAPNSERKAYFAYASFVMSLVAFMLILISIPLMIVYLSTQGLDWGLIFCMPFFYAVFISNKLTRKANQCNQEKYLIELTTKDLFLSLAKYFILIGIFVGIMMWLAS